MKHKLRMTRDQVVERVKTTVAFARTLCDDVEFSPEDAGRSEPEFLWRVLEVAIAAGATTVNIPDTVGYTTPDEFGALIAGIRENVPNIEQARSSASTATTISGWRPRTRWPGCAPARGRRRSRSTASASAREIARSKRS
jgi:isopropylmalate/homocitrate/citramalate synthase